MIDASPLSRLATIVSAVQRDFKDYFQTSTSSALPDRQVERDDGQTEKIRVWIFLIGRKQPNCRQLPGKSCRGRHHQRQIHIDL
jgi:hypothetical protein